MRKILLCLFIFCVFKTASALEFGVSNVRIKNRNVYFTLNIDVAENSVYLTNIKNCYYKIKDECLFIYFEQFALPDTVSCDFPSIDEDKILDKSISLKMKLKIKSESNIPFEEKARKVDLSRIKKIVFELGHIPNADYKIICDEKTNLEQRRKFYYVLEKQEILLTEFNVEK